jgi:RHS repeat-associated protein
MYLSRRQFHYIFTRIVTLALAPLLCSLIQAGTAVNDSGLRFPSNPSPLDFYRARVFTEPLVPVGGEAAGAENSALAIALVGYSKRNSPDDYSAVTEFLTAHPKSPWRASLLTDLGFEYYNTAHYLEALEAWNEGWQLARNATNTQAKAVADRAAGELAYMYARLGRTTELESLLNSFAGRTFVGPATEKIAGARDALWTMKNHPEVAFRCGPLALNQIKLSLDPKHAGNSLIYNSTSTSNGCSLQQVADLSKAIGLDYQMAFRERSAPFVVPCVVHWKAGHYAALVRRDADRYLLQDPTFGNTVWATRQVLETETSGYFLIPPGALRDGWRRVGAGEGSTVWGRGVTANTDPKPIGPCDPQSGGNNPCQPPCQNGADGRRHSKIDIDHIIIQSGNGTLDLDNMTVTAVRMAVSSVHFSTVNLNLSDTPVGHTPPVGPAVEFNVRYNHRDAFQPSLFAYSNFGPKWTSSWISYLTDNPQSPSADVDYYIRGGGTRTFTGFDTNSQTFASQQYDHTRLTRTGAASYQMSFPDGSKLIFGQSDGSVGTSRKVFLSQVRDPFGNTASLAYDADLRLMTIADALGQVTQLAYAYPGDIYKITKVTDPFGRFASFNYDDLGRLTNITDVIGLSSTFTYETNGDFINALITPYGTNTFIRGGTNTTRFLETVYPDGSRDRVEFNQSANLGIPNSDPNPTVPQGMNTDNLYLYGRNTFYWSRDACATSYMDYSKARLYHWLHTSDLTSSSGILESTKEALEGRVWYDYQGQIGAYVVGPNNLPSHVGRVLDDGTTQLSKYQYDEFGHLTNSIDPLGRTISYLYSSNGIDLLEIRQTRGGNNELLARATYNAQHLPLTETDASGHTNFYTYNSRGQVLTETNPKSETTSYTYDNNGYLLAIDGPLPGTNDVSAATYDAFGRIRTHTDVNGYTTTADYDNLDRMTQLTHPDGTFEQITYDRLDPVVIQDRAGRQTMLGYDNIRQLTKRTDALNRVTLFQWCSCGALKTMTDPTGRTTSWQNDVQGRLTSKQYADGSQVKYLYERTTSRLRQVVDEKLQVATYLFNLDNSLHSVSYDNTVVPTPQVSYTYDPNYKRIISRTDGTGTTTYVYNPITEIPVSGAGRLASVDGPLPNDTITYGYDELNRRISTTIGGLISTTTYDAAGRVVNESNLLGSFSYIYDGSSGRVVSESFPNGLTATMGYGTLEQDLNLQSITYQAGTTPISQQIYGRDIPARRITTWAVQADAQPPNVSTFGYDAANQLLSASVTNAGLSVATLTYAYDLSGNRIADQLDGATNVSIYNALNQLAVRSGGLAQDHTNEWDGKDRLVAVNAGPRRTEFTYDAQSRLTTIRTLTNSIEESFRAFVWDNNQLCQERDAAGTVTKRFFSQGVQLSSGPDAGNYYYTRDHLDSIRELIDAKGHVRARYAYDPFGRSTRVSGDLEADFGFAGMFQVSQTGLCFARFRAFDPESGRWLSRDPLRNSEVAEGPNLYAYVGNNPLNLVDPLGLCCETERDAFLATGKNSCPAALHTANLICDLAAERYPDNAYEICLLAAQSALEKCDAFKAEYQKRLDAFEQCLKKPCQPCRTGRAHLDIGQIKIITP